MAYDNNNTGMLSRNTRMREGKKDAPYSGVATVDGKEYWVEAWVKTGKEGGKMAGKQFFSIRFREKQARGQSSTHEQPAQASGGDFDEDKIPF